MKRHVATISKAGKLRLSARARAALVRQVQSRISSVIIERRREAEAGDRLRCTYVLTIELECAIFAGSVMLELGQRP